MSDESDADPSPIAGAYARGIADERARCLAIVRYEAWNFGAGDEPANVAERMSESIARDIKSGRTPSPPPGDA